MYIASYFAVGENCQTYQISARNVLRAACALEHQSAGDVEENTI